jgi:hypothetical protein
MKTEKSNKKVISLVLILSLLSGCAVTSKQIKSGSEVNKSVRLCFSTFKDELTWSGTAYNIPPYKKFSEEVYQEFYNSKQKYPKRWEDFKNRPKTAYNSLNNYYGEDNVWFGTFMTVFTFGIYGIQNISYRASKAPQGISYAELIPICEEKMDKAMKMLPFEEEIEAKRLQLKNKESGDAFKGKQITNLYNQPQTNQLKKIKGPVSGGSYSHVLIESDTIGIISKNSVIIKNSIIRAPICVVSMNGSGVRISNSLLDCDLCVEFRSNILKGNVFIRNTCSGVFSNQPEIFR